MWFRHAVIALALSAWPHAALAHGIAGNRFFVGTLTFDDPSVADEAILPNFSTLNQPVEGGRAVDNRFDWSFTRLLTPVLQAQVDSAWIHRNWSTARTSGFDTTDVGIKSEIYRNNQHEMLVFAARPKHGSDHESGLAYVAVAWQLAAEVIVPLNRQGGSSTGFRAQLLFFLDDLIPKLFDPCSPTSLIEV
jgi:hypothetical protein